MRVPVLLADYPAGTLTGMFIVAGTIGAVLLCLFVAGARRMTESRLAVISRVMQTMRHLLFALAGLWACSPLGAELPKQVGTSPFAVALYDSDGLYGGQELFILTNGVAYARVQRPPEKKESGLQERRYRLPLTTNEVQTLRALLDEHQFLTLTVPGGTGVPHERGATIALRLPDGQRRDVFKWQRHPQAGFTAIHRHLLGIVRRAEKTQPVFQGESIYAWAPEGFVR